MKHLLIHSLAIAGLSAASAQAADMYEFDKTHTNIIWSASHMGFSKSLGTFNQLNGHFTLDETAPEKSSVDVTVETASVVTGIPKFDAHLKDADFFDVEKFPTARFKSTRIEVTGERTAKVHGNLTMMGITEPLTLDATFNKAGTNPYNNKKTAGFSLSGSINRELYGITYALPAVPAQVDIMIEAEGTLKNGTQK